MVSLMENDKASDEVTGKYFMSSVKNWYNEDGIKLGVERVGKLYKNKNYQNKDKDKGQISVTFSILDDMPKCRARVIGEDGKPVKIIDELSGDERDKIKMISDSAEVRFFFNVKIIDEKRNKFGVPPKSSGFPLFNFAFIATGELPEDNTKGIICTQEELKSALMGIEFKAKVKEESFEGSAPYNVLVPSAAINIEEVH